MSDTLEKEVTETSTDTQPQAKTYTQEEFDNHMAGLKSSLLKRFEKKYEDLGDINDLRRLKTEAEKRTQEEQLKRGEFEKTLQELAARKDADIQKRDQIIAEFKLNTPLLEAASTFHAIKPEQVKALLKSQVRLNEEGEVEVLDDSGNIRYSDKGKAFNVSDLVQDFLKQNPHFVNPTKATTNSKSNINSDLKQVKASDFDQTTKEGRDAYREYRKAHGIA